MKLRRDFKLASPAYDSVPSNCGLGVLCDLYEYYEDKAGGWESEFDVKDFKDQGTGIYVAGFIKDDILLNSYNYLKKKCQILYQSPVRVNNNTKNNFFFVVLDTRAEKINNRKYKWPL